MSKQGRLAIKWLAPCGAVLVVAGISLLSYSKGWNSGIQIWGQQYWVIDYSDGLIRRGLMGALLSLLYDGDATDRRWSVVLQIHVATSMLMLTILLLWLRTSLRGCNYIVLLSIAMVFSTSQFLPTLAYNTGYLNAQVYLLVVLAAVCVAIGAYLPAMIIGLIGPFVHDSFIFLWGSLTILMFLSVKQSFSAWKIAVAISAVLSTVVIYFLHSEYAISAQMNKAAIPEDIAARIAHTFGRNISWRVTVMTAKISNNFGNFLYSVLFFCFPTAVIVGTYAWFRSLSPREFTLFSLAALAPAAILMLAWDLSRWLVATTFSAFLGVLFLEFLETRDGNVGVRFYYWLWPAWVTSAFFFLPLVYAYFEVAHVIDAGILPLADTVLGEQLSWFIESRYSRP